MTLSAFTASDRTHVDDALKEGSGSEYAGT